MLVDRTEGALEKAKAFAATRGLSEHFQKKLDFLERWGARPDRGTCCILRTDVHPYSFIFNIKETDMRRYINKGSLIYVGPGDSGSGAPQPTVGRDELKERWDIYA